MGAANLSPCSGADLLTGLAFSAVRLADRAVICDIESEGQRLDRDTWDITAMFDEHEHSPEHIDLAMESIGYAVARRLIEVIRKTPLQVRILRRP